MSFRVVSVIVAFCTVVLTPAMGYAQASITGLVRDASGAVLPGVVVEASSEALIERTRSATTDGSGQYRLVDLRPGVYSVTFTLAGFNTLKRDAVELTGSFTAVVNAELRIGALSETVTVTGESPVVDTQSLSKQAVLSTETFATLPTSRQWQNIAKLIPGVGGAGSDVGGSAGDGYPVLTVHGSKNDAMRTTLNGINFSSPIFDGSIAGTSPNISAMQEITVDTSAADASQSVGGPRINLVPREGGNRFRGTVFFTGNNDKLQGDNLTADLRARGLTSVDAIKTIYDFNPGIGGPIKQDRLWFYIAFRKQANRNFVSGAYYNKNFNDLTRWDYVPDLSRPYITQNSLTDGGVRITWQATPRNKFAIAGTEHDRCSCGGQVTRFQSPEWAHYTKTITDHYMVAEWSSPVSNQVLMDASHLYRRDPGYFTPIFPETLDPRMIEVVEQSTGMSYRGNAQVGASDPTNAYYRASVSYVSGAHALKAGFNSGWGKGRSYSSGPSGDGISYRLLNGIPNQVTLWDVPRRSQLNFNPDLGIFAQDRWTTGRITTTAGVRYDHYATHTKEQPLGPTKYAPNRNIIIPYTEGVSFHDITPRLGVSIDLFGNGKTALKASLNKYLQGFGVQSDLPPSLSPFNRIPATTTRAWTDIDQDFVPDCNLANPAGQSPTTTGSVDICGPFSNANFGTVLPSDTFDPELVGGWGHRAFNWEYSTSVQHEIVPRVAATVGYFRRWYGNFRTTDNRALATSDFSAFNVTAPTHPDLPNGGGYAVTGLYNVNPDKFTALPDNYITFSSNYGKQVEYWQGADFQIDVRAIRGITASGGVATGRTVTDNCEIVEKLPELIAGGTLTPKMFCRQVGEFRTDVKGYVTYTVPRIDVLLAGTFQNVPGPNVLAQYVVTNAVAAPSLGRPLSGGAANVTAHILEPGLMTGERHNQLDLRFSKILRFGQQRIMGSVDLFNALNANTVLAQSNNFGNWQTPTTIVQARMIKFTVNYDF